MNWGMDYLGGAKFQQAIMQAHPNGWAAGVFANPFGDAWPMINKLAASGRAPLIRVHAIYESDHRYIKSKHDPIIKREAERCAQLQIQFPIRVEFSPFCEHTMTKGEFKAIMAMIAELELTIVNNPMQFSQMKNVINECHLSKKPMGGEAYNFSLDGDSAVDCNIEEYKAIHSGADTFFFWNCQFNGKRGDSDTTAIPNRTFWPDAELIKSVAYLANPRGKTNLKPPYTWKSHAEDSKDSRANKPLLLAPETVGKVDLLLNDNSVLISANRYSIPYLDGRQRYYFDGLYGYQIANKAIKKQGSPVCRIRMGDKVIGRVNPAFRDGSYH